MNIFVIWTTFEKQSFALLRIYPQMRLSDKLCFLWSHRDYELESVGLGDSLYDYL